jgi:hypothetical protein
MPLTKTETYYGQTNYATDKDRHALNKGLRKLAAAQSNDYATDKDRDLLQSNHY